MKKIYTTIALIVLFSLTSCGVQKDETMMKDKAMMKDEAMVKDETMMKDKAMMKDEAMVKKGSYTSYSTDMLGKTENTVIFFHAAWCPSCRAADSGIIAGVVPENLSILKADYDSETELKKQYGVTSQHTFVLVDANGEMIKKWTGGTTIDSIVEKI